MMRLTLYAIKLPIFSRMRAGSVIWIVGLSLGVAAGLVVAVELARNPQGAVVSIEDRP